MVALLVSGSLPAVGISLGMWRHHGRVDAVGVVVLFGILTGVVVGLASGSARLVLLDGTVPTGVFGAACYVSLLSPRPFMFRVALQFLGADSRQGRDFASKWQYREFRHMLMVITVVWGAAFLVETGAQLAIVQSASLNTAKTTSNLMPIAVAILVASWTFLYGQRERARGERASQSTETQEGTDTAVALADTSAVDP